MELIGKGQRNGRLVINTLINKQQNDETVERLFSDKIDDTSLIINMDKNPKKRKDSKRRSKKKRRGDDDDDD